MKQPYLFLLLLFTSSISFSQSQFGFKKGAIIKKNGDSLNCYIELSINYGKYLFYKINANDDASYMKMKEIKFVLFDHAEFETIPMEKGERLLKIEYDGKIGLYKYTTTDDNVIDRHRTATSTVSQFIDHFVVKKGSTVIEINLGNYIDQFKLLMSDCPKLVSQIVDGTYQYKDIKEIVAQYDECK